MHTVLVLGGYGFFGQRIAGALADDTRIRLLIGGRDAGRAEGMARRLLLPAPAGVRIDAADASLEGSLRELGVDTLIHTAGPFQGQDYTVARAAIDAGCNYIDLADGRAFVNGIGQLTQAAQARGVSVFSGASSVPALSAAVVDRYAPAFMRLDAIQMGISSGARAPGLATVRGVFSYCGKPIRRLEAGRWVHTYGWRDLRRHRFPEPVGTRWLCSCDIPDLDLFPRRYPTVQSVTFHAGFASGIGHLIVWALAGLVKAGLLDDMGVVARPLSRVSRWIEPLVSDKGAMFVEMSGLDDSKRPLVKRWHLLASQNHGPYVPCGAAVALARKLAGGQPLPKGAMPCAGLLTVADYLAPLSDLDIREMPAQ